MHSRGTTVALVASLAALLWAAQAVAPGLTAGEHEKPDQVSPESRLGFQDHVVPILNKRCVVCHSCYDAPCQLKLSSREGSLRGASKEYVYYATRLKPMAPTRLFVDATSVKEWRKKGFFSVLDDGAEIAGKPGARSLLERMIALGRERPFTPNAKLPDSVGLEIYRELSCPTPKTMDDYAKEHPLGGMPYGMAPLSAHEYEVLLDWARKGIPGAPAQQELPVDVQKDVDAWEALLNGNSKKERLAARYLYEHLFLAHVYFEGAEASRYFRLVRSRTHSGQAIEEIDTRHPNGEPGPKPFFYRLRPIDSAIVGKAHIVYPLSDSRLRRIRELFFSSDWDVDQLPPYDRQAASNPFQAFSAIPARARYLFLLDNAQYFVRTFIRGPVCRGQIALNVIDDHFFVAFLDPDYDLSVTDSAFLRRAQDILGTPHMSRSVLSLAQMWRRYYSVHRDYLKLRQKAYFKHDPMGRQQTLDTFWSGDRQNSFLTVFRHFDSASVVPGFVGGIPKKLWVLDYPILERIYYDLVVNFDVFGNVTHQLLTRLYMDYLRMESEDITLSFLPPGSRQDVRSRWYRGAEAQLELFLLHKLPSYQRGTAIEYTTQRPMTELTEKMLTHFPALSDTPDHLNRCKKQACIENGAVFQADELERQLRKLTAIRGAFVRQMPDLAFLRIRTGGPPKDDLAYTIIRNKAHSNVAFIFGEDWRRLEQEDTLTIVKGYVGSYPNFFFDVRAPAIDTFVSDLMGVQVQEDFEQFVLSHGVRRTSPAFWATSDWFNSNFSDTAPVEAGLFDLSRYNNH